MSKPMLGLLLGGLLGLIDGLSALAYPDAAAMIVPIVVGSTIKGLITGIALGALARRVRSIPLGILAGLGLGLGLSYLAALTPDPQGHHHYFEIMLPGAILGLIVGFATQRFGASANEKSARPVTVLILFVALAGSPVSSESPKAPPDPFHEVRFLVGQWTGTSEGQAGKGRETYERVSADEFTETFEVAPPGKPFEVYGKARLRRIR